MKRRKNLHKARSDNIRLRTACGLLVLLAVVCTAQYSSRRQPERIIELGKPDLQGSRTLEEILAKPPLVQRFTPEPLELKHLAQLAWAGQGVVERQTGLRTTTSVNGVYPAALYLATADGLFAYNPDSHTLRQIAANDIRGALALAAAGNIAVGEAACDVIVAASVRQLAAIHGRAARRYVLVHAGQVVQNILLQSAGLELGAVPVYAFEQRQVERLCRLPKQMEPICIVAVGHQPSPQPQTVQAGQSAALLVVPETRFQDEEFFETKLALDQAGIRTAIASVRPGPVRGMGGTVAEAQFALDQLDITAYDAVVFIGGPGAARYFDDPLALETARRAAQGGKLLAAISIAPTILANAGLLSEVRVTALPAERNKLTQAGAIFTGDPVTRDGLILTGRDPAAARLFGRAIAEALTAAVPQQ